MPASSSSPLPADAGFCLLVPDFLDHAECAELIAFSEGRGYVSAAADYPPSYRNNDRHVLDSEDLAIRLTQRLRAHAPATLTAADGDWRFDGINERFRFCRYRAGQRFNVHRDGIHHRGAGWRSHLTVLVYLTDGDAFDGGDTVFYAGGPGTADGARELGRVRPRAGSLLLFDHDIWHAGAEVAAGTKHVLRSDVLYRRPADAAIAHETTAAAHEGYVWTLCALDDGFTASGGRDATVRIWNAHIGNAHGGATGALHGHEQSVLGLAALPGGRIASVSRDRSLRIWDRATGTCEAVVRAHEAAVLDVVALADGTLATGGADGLVKLWSHAGRALGELRGHTGWVWQLAAFGASSLASASEDGTVRLWDTATGECLAVLAGDRPLRTLLAVDGAIWTGDIDGRIVRWTREAGNWTPSHPTLAHHAAIRRLRRVGDNRVASCGEDCLLRVWDIGTGDTVFEARHANFVTDALPVDGGVLASAYDGRIVRHEGE